MCGCVFGAQLAVIAEVAREGEYLRVCEAAKAEGAEPPSRDSYFGKPIKWEAPAPNKDGDWWSLGLAVLIGGML
jgi:hypothetical protein